MVKHESGKAAKANDVQKSDLWCGLFRPFVEFRGIAHQCTSKSKRSVGEVSKEVLDDLARTVRDLLLLIERRSVALYGRMCFYRVGQTCLIRVVRPSGRSH